VSRVVGRGIIMLASVLARRALKVKSSIYP
jgi:hypothetical protein